ncbi:N-acetylmuramic acid 6-phosphate etherase [Culicoidibacter larvae]|uniref:N-acetylmuramic acid 6-phosphate etherase n=1 Tax=Culicoidibacter larvae TaxID=2579976 RepID=A0A5R8QBP3_9FIRM|nr:N-acetylmuramic acid 6-phosphate etherase [Culicoidibacter larvae]TLG72748.1 N-acetylmuramic acid 6-phosphate etherase [Culicoidibacter larvae]
MLENLTTEKRNENTKHLDQLSALEFATVMNHEDQKVALAIATILPEIAEVIELLGKQYRAGGRIIYIGAGTSGRIGVLDAVECVPTFGVSFDEFIGIIAGGERAFVRAVEGAEDSRELAVNDLAAIDLQPVDVVIGIAASGRTPYVISGLEYANEIGARTVAVACNIGSAIGAAAQHKLEVDAGPEVLTGSTRLKAGSAQKMILNMLSTGAMVQAGKVFGNLMVDVQLTNEKLVERAKRIIIDATGVSYEQAEQVLHKAENKPKVAIVMIKANCDYQEAVNRLNQADGFISRAI